MENEETKVPSQEGGAEQHEEKVVASFATPIKFGGIEVKNEADVVKAQEAYKAQSARATKAEQEFAAYKKANPVKTEEKAKEVIKEEKPKEESFLTKQAHIAEQEKSIETYVDGQFSKFEAKGNNKLFVEAFGGEVKSLVKTLVAQNGENALKGLKVQEVFDAVIKNTIKKGRTKENIEAFNKAVNLRNLNDGTATIKEVKEVFEYFKKASGKPAVAGEKIDTLGLGQDDGKNDFNSELKDIKSKVKKGELSPREGQRAIKKLQKAHVKFN